MKSALATRLAAPALLVLALAGCFVDYDFDNTSFACSDGTCPAGYECVAERCVAPASGGDAGSNRADATSGDNADASPIPSDAAVQLATCDEQFGASTGYQLCIEAETTCEFFHLSEVAEACADVCALYGAACTTTYNSDEGTPCTRQEEAVCTTTRQSQICVCSRGDGA